MSIVEPRVDGATPSARMIAAAIDQKGSRGGTQAVVSALPRRCAYCSLLPPNMGDNHTASADEPALICVSP